MHYKATIIYLLIFLSAVNTVSLWGMKKIRDAPQIIVPTYKIPSLLNLCLAVTPKVFIQKSKEPSFFSGKFPTNTLLIPLAELQCFLMSNDCVQHTLLFSFFSWKDSDDFYIGKDSLMSRNFSITHNGRYKAAQFHDGKIQVINNKTNETIKSFEYRSFPCFAWAPCHDYLATTIGDNKSVIIFKPETDESFTLSTNSEAVIRMVWSWDAKRLAMHTYKSCHIAKIDKLPKDLIIPIDGIDFAHNISFCSDSKNIVGIDDGVPNIIQIIDCKTKKVRKIEMPKSEISLLRSNPHNNLLACRQDSNKLLVLKITEKAAKIVQEIVLEEKIQQILWSPAGDSLALLSENIMNMNVYVSFPSLSLSVQLRPSAYVSDSVKWHPQGHYLAVASYYDTIWKIPMLALVQDELSALSIPHIALIHVLYHALYKEHKETEPKLCLCPTGEYSHLFSRLDSIPKESIPEKTKKYIDHCLILARGLCHPSAVVLEKSEETTTS